MYTTENIYMILFVVLKETFTKSDYYLFTHATFPSNKKKSNKYWTYE